MCVTTLLHVHSVLRKKARSVLQDEDDTDTECDDSTMNELNMDEWKGISMQVEVEQGALL